MSTEGGAGRRLRDAARRHGLALAALGLLAAVGLATYRDYGLAWDEPLQREIGTVSYDYVVHGDRRLAGFRDRDYGVAVELPLVALERALGLEDTRDVFFMRHLVAHLLFLAGSFAGYVLAYRLFGDRLVALGVFLAVALHPRLYAHSFFNTKDIPFMAGGLVCLALFESAVRRGGRGRLLLLGVATGVLTGIRVMGVQFVVLFALFLLLERAAAGRRWAAGAADTALFTAVAAGTLVLVWPFLWESPAAHFLQAFANMSRFRWPGEVLFAGAVVRPDQLPWTFVPRWLGMTTPPLVLAAGAAGLAAVALGFAARPLGMLRERTGRAVLLLAACFAAPLGAVWALHARLYDDWRQLFFVYPPLVLLGGYALHLLRRRLRRPAAAAAVALAAAAQLAAVLAFMVRSHPLEHLYFGEHVVFRPGELRASYEMDYWGTAYRGALEGILAADPAPRVRVNVATPAGELALQILEPAARRRLRVRVREDLGGARYFVTCYRWRRGGFDLGGAQVVYERVLYGSPVVTAWRRPAREAPRRRGGRRRGGGRASLRGVEPLYSGAEAPGAQEARAPRRAAPAKET